jgi:acylphosphatase
MEPSGRNRWKPVANGTTPMVRRGSTVGIRQRAFAKYLQLRQEDEGGLTLTPVVALGSAVRRRRRRSRQLLAVTTCANRFHKGMNHESRNSIACGIVVRRRVIVHGFVQGVGFRFSIARAAESRSVTGWVRNRWDGTVEAVFEGEREPVESLVRFCGEGPRGAAVARVEVFEEEPEGLARFAVR